MDTSEEGFNPRSFERLYQQEAGSFWFRSRNRLILWAIGKYFRQAGRFLEIGCGSGFVLSTIRERFTEMECAGSEIQTTGLNYAQIRNAEAPLWQMDGRDIPFEDEFGLIGAFDVLEHIKEDEIVLKQMGRATRYGGGILLTVPQHPWLWSNADVRAHHVRRYTRDELVLKVEKAGFEILRVTSFVTILLPAMLLSRKTDSRTEKVPSVELSIPKLLNSTFGLIMKFEFGLVRMGINLPVGGSLLLIAKKRN